MAWKISPKEFKAQLAAIGFIESIVDKVWEKDGYWIDTFSYPLDVISWGHDDSTDIQYPDIPVKPAAEIFEHMKKIHDCIPSPEYKAYCHWSYTNELMDEVFDGGEAMRSDY